MKVVLFCGGLGMRIREYSEEVPKPMVPIGYRPILWHVMKYYAHWGHKEFILCLGYKADVIKNYFLNYDECLSNDFTLSGSQVQLANSDIDDWKITFVDTGHDTNIGGRLRAVRDHLQDDEMFLANYSDNLTDVPMDAMIQKMQKNEDRVASFLCVRPSQSFHVVSLDAEHRVSGIHHVSQTDIRINGGYFVLRREIFDHMKPGEELVEAPFERLLAARRLGAYSYDGFFVSMDTFKERQTLDDLYTRGEAPWEVWKRKKTP